MKVLSRIIGSSPWDSSAAVSAAASARLRAQSWASFVFEFSRCDRVWSTFRCFPRVSIALCSRLIVVW